MFGFNAFYKLFATIIPKCHLKAALVSTVLSIVHNNFGSERASWVSTGHYFAAISRIKLMLTSCSSASMEGNYTELTSG